MPGISLEGGRSGREAKQILRIASGLRGAGNGANDEGNSVSDGRSRPTEMPLPREGGHTLAETKATADQFPGLGGTQWEVVSRGASVETWRGNEIQCRRGGSGWLFILLQFLGFSPKSGAIGERRRTSPLLSLQPCLNSAEDVLPHPFLTTQTIGGSD